MTRPARPKHLNLLVIHLPITGVVSIIHRLTGVLLVLATPLAILLLERSLSSPEGYAQVQAWFAGWPARMAIVVLVWALAHHLLAGLRYLLLDIDIGVERPAARRSAGLAIVGGILAAALTVWGVWP